MSNQAWQRVSKLLGSVDVEWRAILENVFRIGYHEGTIAAIDKQVDALAAETFNITPKHADEMLSRLDEREQRIANWIALGYCDLTLAAFGGFDMQRVEDVKASICRKLGCEINGVPRIVFAAKFAAEEDSNG